MAADDITLLEWLFGGLATAFGGAFIYLNTSTSKTSEELAKHKTTVAEKYLTKDDFVLASNGFTKNFERLEGRIESGNRANLESNEKIRSEISAGQNTIVNMISNGDKTRAHVDAGNAAIIAAIANLKPSN